MKVESAKEIVSALKNLGINFISSLPSNYFAPLLAEIEQDQKFLHVSVANEEDSIGLCYGAYLAGKKPVFIAQNSGLAMAIYALMDSIYWFGNFPLLMIIDHRGDFGDPTGWVYFGYGIQIPRILESFQVPYSVVREPANLKDEIINGGQMVKVCRKAAAILISGRKI